MGAIALAKMLKLNSALIELQLNCNKIGDAGAIVLAEALEINRTLAYLYIKDNPEISDAGVNALFNVLRDNETLVSLEEDHTQAVNGDHKDRRNEVKQAIEDLVKNKNTDQVDFLKANAKVLHSVVCEYAGDQEKWILDFGKKHGYGSVHVKSEELQASSVLFCALGRPHTGLVATISLQLSYTTPIEQIESALLNKFGIEIAGDMHTPVDQHVL